MFKLFVPALKWSCDQCLNLTHNPIPNLTYNFFPLPPTTMTATTKGKMGMARMARTNGDGKGQGNNNRGGRSTRHISSSLVHLFTFTLLIFYLLNVLELSQRQQMAQSPKWTQAQDICIQYVIYIYVFALLNNFLLDWYGTATRMTKVNNHHIQDNKWEFKTQMMHLECLSKFFLF